MQEDVWVKTYLEMWGVMEEKKEEGMESGKGGYEKVGRRLQPKKRGSETRDAPALFFRFPNI